MVFKRALKAGLQELYVGFATEALRVASRALQLSDIPFKAWCLPWPW